MQNYGERGQAVEPQSQPLRQVARCDRAVTSCTIFHRISLISQEAEFLRLNHLNRGDETIGAGLPGCSRASIW